MDGINTRFIFLKKQRRLFIALIAIGVISLIIGVLLYSKKYVWSALLLNSVNYLTIALGATFLVAVHIISRSGWHVVFERIIQAVSMYLPFSVVFMLILFFGLNNIFEWTHEIHHDPVVAKKAAYLNVPFFILRSIFLFVVWIVFALALRHFSRKSDFTPSKKLLIRSRVYAALFVVFFALSIVVFAWDWLMSIEAHWFSTLFGWYVLAGILVKSFAVIIILLAILRYLGYFEFVSIEHIHDLARYLFSFSIFWVYLWFSQFMLIWYANIPEETFYFINRIENYPILFFLNIGCNFLIPFLVLIARKSRRTLWLVVVVAIIVFIGQWIDQYLMIFPGIIKTANITWFDIGLSIGFAGIFLLVIFVSLSRFELIPKNHPYLQESLHFETNHT